MPHSRVPVLLAALSVSASAAVAAWGFSVDPGAAVAWLFVGGFLPTLWAFLEFAQVRGSVPGVGAAIMAVHRYTIAFAGFILASEVGLRLMVRQGLVGPSWLSTGQQLRGLIVGGWMVVFGNLLPTLRSPWRLEHQPFAWQQVHRFVGWTFVLGGFAIIASWALLPPGSAERSSVRIWAVVLTLALGRKVVSLSARSFGSR